MQDLPKATPQDHSILAVLQLIQPANSSELLVEIKDVPHLSSLKLAALDSHLSRLLNDKYIVEAGNKRYIVSPTGYFLVKKSLLDKQRDHARLLHLNRQRFS